METTADLEVAQVEELLKKPSAEFQREVRARTGAAPGEESLAGGTLEVWGVVKVPGASTTGVSSKPLAEFPLSEVYGYSRSDAVLFMSEAAEIAKHIDVLGKMSQEDVESELIAALIWRKIQELQRFVGTSAGHNELICALQQLVVAEAPAVLSKEKISTLGAVFEDLRRKVRISDITLDDIYNKLETVGFDIGPAF